jgi:hypothetical protein
MIRGRAAACAALLLAAPAIAAPAIADETWDLSGDRAFVKINRDDPGVGLLSARLSAPTTRYVHGVLGGIPMFSRLSVTARSCETCPLTEAAIDLPDDLVFEDIAPRFWDAGGDNLPEIVLVEAHPQKRRAVDGLDPGDGRSDPACYHGFHRQPATLARPGGIG